MDIKGLAGGLIALCAAASAAHAADDPVKGEAQFAPCSACHSVAADPGGMATPRGLSKSKLHLSLLPPLKPNQAVGQASMACVGWTGYWNWDQARLRIDQMHIAVLTECIA